MTSSYLSDSGPSLKEPRADSIPIVHHKFRPRFPRALDSQQELEVRLREDFAESYLDQNDLEHDVMGFPNEIQQAFSVERSLCNV